MPSNQGREIGLVIRDLLDTGAMVDATKAMHIEIKSHPVEATCECPLIEALAVLYEHGYRLTPTLIPTRKAT